MDRSHRKCGNCFACCSALGIKELDKPPGVPCKHLTAANGTARRCSIYKDRPPACVSYMCAWRSGLFDDNMRPDHSGLLVTIYAADDSPLDDDGLPERMWATINVTNHKRAGTMTKGHLAHTLRHLLSPAHQRIAKLTVLYRESGTVIEFDGGDIYEGKLLPTEGVEELCFERLRPIGHYMAADSVADIPADIRDRAIVLP